MRKVVIHRPGGYERLKIEEAPALEPSPGEVLVEIRAVGINYADCVIRMGLYQSAKDYVGWPITPGFEFSGVVRRLGQGVVGFREGEQVFGVSRFGAYASEISIPAHQLFRLPAGLAEDAAAGFPTIFLSAYFPLVEMVRIHPGMKVLVHSAAGGVGSAMVQIARLQGAEVTGVVGGAHKTQPTLELGAKHVIDKSSEDLWRRVREIAPAGFDVIADANGVSTLGRSFAHLAPAGRLIIYGFHSMLPRAGKRMNYLKLAWDYLRTPRFNPIEMTNQNKSVLCFNLSYLFDRSELLSEGMAFLLGHLAKGTIRAPRITRFAFDQVAEAHRALESGQTVGKLVLTLN